MNIYKTYFKLTNPVLDIDAANAYLTKDDMTQYLKQDTRIPEDVRNAVEKIEWRLKDESSGRIELIANTLLSSELKLISEWVSGQNSDGLGEGFTGQDFANYKSKDDQSYDNFYDDEYDEEDDYIMASFDWETNEYIFEFIYKTFTN